MSRLGIVHSGYALPILGTLSKAGENVDLALANAKLPPDVLEHPFQPMPHFLATYFVVQAAQKMGDENFPFTSLSEFKILTPEMIPLHNVALEAGGVQKLRALVGDMNRSTPSVLHLVDGKDELWIDLQWAPGEGSPPWSAELYVAGLILSAVRAVLGADWQPSAMKMLSPRRQDRDRACLPDCPVLWNAQTISVAIDRWDMANRVTGSELHQGYNLPHSISNLSEASPELVCETISGLLRQEYQSLSDVADFFGLSKKSFQRRLDGYGLRYGQIVENFRIERAISALQQEDVSVTDLSLELGYAHSQNFARAFRRRVGLSPRQYRSALFGPPN